MTGQAMIAELLAGRRVPGRHLVVCAHPDDETVSFAGGLSALEDVTLLQVTTAVQRSEERAAAMEAGRWPVRVVDLGIADGCAHRYVRRVIDAVTRYAAGVAAVWTHPYEHGHIDHDTCSFAVQTALDRLPAETRPIRFEFASYYAQSNRVHVFGAFAPGASVGARCTLTPAVVERKMAALRCYLTQASNVAKFRTPAVEEYRVAPMYDFRKAAPVPASRWDARGYQPSTTAWRKWLKGWEQLLAV